mgnify:CR=1 FL=1
MWRNGFEIFNKINSDIKLSIVGKPGTLKLNNDKISYLGYINSTDKLIKIYDEQFQDVFSCHHLNYELYIF